MHDTAAHPRPNPARPETAVAASTRSRPATASPGTLRRLVEHPRTQTLVIALIVLNAALLGVETWAAAMALAGPLVSTLDKLLLAVFVVEIGARMTVYRGNFWRDPWNVFDFAVVAIALLPAAGPFAVLRALRVLRVLRLLTLVPSMRRVVGALLAAIPGLGSTVLVLLIVYYVFAVIATNLFSASHPEWFGDLGRSLFTLFQIMTLESWSMGIARPVMQEFPYAWAFFVPFILVATFTMLNLFIAIIVNAMQSHGESERKREPSAAVTDAPADPDLYAELRGLRGEIQALKALLERRGVGAAAAAGERPGDTHP